MSRKYRGTDGVVMTESVADSGKPQNGTFIMFTIGMSNLASKLGQISPKWNKSGNF